MRDIGPSAADFFIPATTFTQGVRPKEVVRAVGHAACGVQWGFRGKPREDALDARAISWEERRMEYPLHFGKQVWKPMHAAELTLFLPASLRYGISFHADFTFVPHWVDPEGENDEYRTMNLDVEGYLPGLRNWRELEGYETGGWDGDDEDGGPDGVKVVPPELSLWSNDRESPTFHTHAKEGWETRLKFVECDREDPARFIVEVEAFFPSERAREAHFQLWLKSLFNRLDYGDEEKERLMEEGWRFRYRGPLSLGHVSCRVPLNVPDPVQRAKRMAEQELAMREFGFCRVNGGENDGTFKPEDGICGNDRLVLVSPRSAFYDEWMRREEERKRRKKPPGT